ncbi:alpha/beta hydrolase [Mycobacterium sp. NPDC050853]|uniref:alpha/beta hydrolase family protein n=1 Tax=Mycobacterium sp. NPDC050853 TaxID=3155160 RepID=UPI0033CEF40D
MLIAVASVIALATSAGIWVIVANDFAIHEEQVIVPGSAEPLHGVLALPPQGKGPYGLVVFVHGDGPADATRDSFYRPIWESLAKAGYASLAWNKPGIDGAPGNWLNQSMHDRATEAEAAITWARGRSDIDPKRIGAWGISQGGWVVPELAVRQPDMQFVILVGAAVNWLRQGEYNLVAEMRNRNASAADITTALDERKAKLKPLFAGATYEQYLASHADAEPMSADRWEFVKKNYRADISETLPKLRVPVLLELGEDDLNVDVHETERVYRALVRPDLLTVQMYPRASHSLARASLDNVHGIRTVLVATFAPRSLYAPGYLDNLRHYVEQTDSGKVKLG